MKNELIRRSVGLALGLVLCIFTGAFWEGLLFLGAAFFVSAPKLPRCRWYEVALGAQAGAVVYLLAGDSRLVFWGLFAIAVGALSLQSLWKTVLVALGALAMLKWDAAAIVYVNLFIGIIWNAILDFTYQKIYGTIKVNETSQNERVDNIG